MTTALSVLREEMSREMGDYWEGTTTSAGDDDKLTLYDTALGRYANDVLIGYYVKFTGGAGVDAGAVRRITDFVSSSGTVTVGAVFNAVTPTSKTYEIHAYDPTDKDEALKRAVRQVYPYLWARHIDDTFISGNFLNNGSFEELDSGAVPTHWTASGATATRETAIANRRHGLASLKLVSTTTADYAYQSQAENPSLLDLAGQSITLQGWCKTDLASSSRLQIWTRRADSTQATKSGSYQTQANRWQMLEIADYTLPDDLEAIEIRLTCYKVGANNATTYWDGVRLLGPPCYRYWLPYNMIDLDQVWLQRWGGQQNDGSVTSEPADDWDSEQSPYFPLLSWRVEDDGTDQKLYTHQSLPSGYKLRLVGRKYLGALSADTDTVEINAPQTLILVALAVAEFFKAQASVVAAAEAARYVALGEQWERIYYQRLQQYRMVPPAKHIALPGQITGHFYPFANVRW